MTLASRDSRIVASAFLAENPTPSQADLAALLDRLRASKAICECPAATLDVDFCKACNRPKRDRTSEAQICTTCEAVRNLLGVTK